MNYNQLRQPNRSQVDKFNVTNEQFLSLHLGVTTHHSVHMRRIKYTSHVPAYHDDSEGHY